MFQPETTQKPRAVLLYRASSKQQTDSENDIPLQRDILKPWCEQQGYEFYKELVEGGISGYKVSAEKRDAIQEIKRMADNREFQVLLIYMSDRLGRLAAETPLIVSYLNNRGIRVVSYREGEISASNHTEMLMTYIRFWQAEGESIKTSARVCDAVLDNVRKGRWRGGTPPYGYRSVSRGTLNGKGKPILDVEIDPVTSEHVKTMFELYTTKHYGTRVLAKYLNDNDIPTPKGTLWNSSLVCKVLRCKTYIGIYELHRQTKNKPLIESPVMPHLVIIDEATWHKAQACLAKNSTGPRRPPTRRGALLLTGLAYCKACGNKMTSFYSYSGTEQKKPIGERIKRYYYRCISEMKPKSTKPKCRPTMYSADILEERVIFYAKNFVTTLDREKLIAEYEDESMKNLDEATKRLDRAEADLAKNEKEVKKLKDEIMRALLGESIFSQTTLSEMLKAKEAESLELLQRQEDAQNRIMELEQELSLQKTVAEEFDDWEAKFDRATTSEKKSMLLNIIDRIDVQGDKVGVTFKAEINPLNRFCQSEGIRPLDERGETTQTSTADGAGLITAPETAISLYPRAVNRYELAQKRNAKFQVTRRSGSITQNLSLKTPTGYLRGFMPTKRRVRAQESARILPA